MCVTQVSAKGRGWREGATFCMVHGAQLFHVSWNTEQTKPAVTKNVSWPSTTFTICCLFTSFLFELVGVTLTCVGNKCHCMVIEWNNRIRLLRRRSLGSSHAPHSPKNACVGGHCMVDSTAHIEMSCAWAYNSREGSKHSKGSKHS